MDWGVGEKTSLIWLKKKKKGLEISPLFAPLILKDEGDVMYCDYIDYESLKNRENNNQGRIDCGLEVQPIDFVWPPEKALKDCTNVKFDYIVSSHVLEHVPNFIGYIHEMKSVLITLAGFLVLGVLLPCVVLAEEKQEKILTGAISLVQAQQTVLLKNTDLQAFSYEVRVREAEMLQYGLLPNPRQMCV